jgi:hypothetical protein
MTDADVLNDWMHLLIVDCVAIELETSDFVWSHVDE